MHWFTITYLIILYYSIAELGTSTVSDHKFIPPDIKETDNSSLPCDTLIIFDLSKNVVSKEVFDISFKIFLKYILKYCNSFKYVAIDDNFNGCGNLTGCNVTIDNCDASNGCEKIIDELEYSLMTSAYSDDLNDVVDGKAFLAFLNEVFLENQLNPYILLTNRITSFDPDTTVIETIDNSSIKFMALLLGRNETKAGFLLEREYEKIPTATALSFRNYDCLSYLFYCILPCSNDKPKCMNYKDDVNDCQYPSKWTPNPYPDKTLHIWYVLAFSSNPLDFNAIRDNMVIGLKNYVQTHNISRVIIKIVYGIDGWWWSPFEDIDKISTITSVITGADEGDVLDDDYDFMNSDLSFIPWSGTLTETRIGILAIVVITNFATKSLSVVNDNQQLLAQMHIYNTVSYEYYSGILKNDINFHLHLSNFHDVVSINPITTQNFTTTPATTFKTSSTSSTKFAISALPKTSRTSTNSTTSPTSATISKYATTHVIVYCTTIIIFFFFLYKFL